jgi:membrane protein implicated in regulation of membrane protease activity
MFVGIVAGYLVFRYVTHWLAGALIGVICVITLAFAGYWLPLAFLVAVVAIVVWIVRRVAKEDAAARPVRDLAARYSAQRPGLRADTRARLAPR